MTATAGGPAGGPTAPRLGAVSEQGLMKDTRLVGATLCARLLACVLWCRRPGSCSWRAGRWLSCGHVLCRRDC
ncbi:hypothetical protein HaLaN_03685 [Haematococcus lacustris]|uniref:Uncharacterized protein n=1 Tax=Haematococcus lacustris TaxID=44745 RepID=A0A699YPN5_HAELA|nr:hypothetical protein HaLaN_03685 [Haematococcus lacustris]